MSYPTESTYNSMQLTYVDKTTKLHNIKPLNQNRIEK